MPRSPRRPRRFVTSLGPHAELRDAVWTLDLSDLPIFHGLSVLARALGDLVIEQCRADRMDVAVERTVSGRENPELHRSLRVARVKVCGEHAALGALAAEPERLHDHLRALLGTLQRQVYRDALFPPPGTRSRALVFDFDDAAANGRRRYRATIERILSSAGAGHCFLRLTIDDGARRARGTPGCLPVRDLAQRTFIAGSTRIAQTWRDGIVREAERGRQSFVETARPHSHLFAQLARAGLPDIVEVAITWPDACVPVVLENPPGDLEGLLKYVLLALEDRSIRSHLADGQVIRVVAGDSSVYLDRAQLGRVLHVSLERPRERTGLSAFLDRMPRTREVGPPGRRPLDGVKILLVHHITAETAGLIAALRRLGCRDLSTVFVAYAGEAPGALLGPLLDLPPDEFRCLALANVPDRHRVEGHYRLSSRYSRLENEAALAAALARRPGRYFDAMQAVAVLEFVRLLERADRAGERCLVIEDGGYLAPALNAACLEGLTVREFLADLAPESRDARPLADALAASFVGSVEHTRNGFDRLEAVERRHGRLAFPAFSIAVSRLKREMEAGEVAASVLNAVENVLHATGRVLSRRTCLVLGSRGAIGARLVRALGGRLADPASQLFGVDLRAPSVRAADVRPVEAARYADLPAHARARIDLVLGVTGSSVFGGSEIEDWLARSERPELVLASGSTKTVEFAGVADWLDRLLASPRPRAGGRGARVQSRPILDPQTGRVFGHRYRLALDGGPERRLTLLANLTPINFLFYGVPTEAIDEVMAQLLRSAVALAAGPRARPAARLHAVDRDITADGVPLDAGLDQTPTRRQYSAF